MCLFNRDQILLTLSINYQILFLKIQVNWLKLEYNFL